MASRRRGKDKVDAGTRKCPACGYENSPKTIKCYECGKMFYTNEELAARFPPGRGGSDWHIFYLPDDNYKKPHDPVVEYAAEIGTTWKPDPKLGSWEAWIAPDGTFWPVGYQQHARLAPALVAKFDLWGTPTCSEHDGKGGSVSRDKYGREYYDAMVRYPDSIDILKENGWLELGHSPFQYHESAIYPCDCDETATAAQRRTIERWRKKHKVKYIEHYDPWENRPREGENDAKINE